MRFDHFMEGELFFSTFRLFLNKIHLSNDEDCGCMKSVIGGFKNHENFRMPYNSGFRNFPLFGFEKRCRSQVVENLAFSLCLVSRQHAVTFLSSIVRLCAFIITVVVLKSSHYM